MVDVCQLLTQIKNELIVSRKTPIILPALPQGNVIQAPYSQDVRTLDGKGKILWMDDFEATQLKWRSAGGASLAATCTYRGDQAAKLTSAVTADINQYFKIPLNAKIGIEFKVNFDRSDFPVNYFAVDMIYYDGANSTYTQFVWHHVVNRLLLYSGALAALKTVADNYHDVNASNDPGGVWHPFKIILDCRSNVNETKVLKIITATTTYDTSSFAMARAANAVIEPCLLISLSITGAGTGYIDDFILTLEE